LLVVEVLEVLAVAVGQEALEHLTDHLLVVEVLQNLA
jgi:hypothetical protein